MGNSNVLTREVVDAVAVMAVAFVVASREENSASLVVTVALVVLVALATKGIMLVVLFL